MTGSFSDAAFVRSLADEVRSSGSVAVASLLATRGSMPRHEGARMAVRADGSTWGTVGGGELEQIATGLGRASASGEGERFSLAWQTRERHGMACGGDALLAVVSLGASDLEFLASLADALGAGASGWVREDWSDPSAPVLSFVRAEGPGAPAEALPDVAFWDEGARVYTEPVGPDPVCYVFGAGHVGQALVPVLASVAFRVVVYDDRPELARPELFPAAERVVGAGFTELLDYVSPTARDYVVVLTHGHLGDVDVLERVLPSRPAYVGCIGSASKAAFARRSLVERGLDPRDVEAVHLPIGEKILAVTPAEIAVSIAAEMIRCRAERRPVRPHAKAPSPSKRAFGQSSPCPQSGEGA